ncbi:hypothetical protein HMPREF1556_01938 [Porphyromonas sp. oral taxon 278 str. W7784]|nr:hypothetical protein HMPREF1556_01938 [Porphyromonas sp. oral taxon 278 str. W7784]
MVTCSETKDYLLSALGDYDGVLERPMHGSLEDPMNGSVQ